MPDNAGKTTQIMGGNIKASLLILIDMKNNNANYELSYCGKAPLIGVDLLLVVFIGLI
jgi:hypothetical protein